MNLKGRNFLTLKDFTSEEIEYLIDLSAELKAKKKAIETASEHLKKAKELHDKLESYYIEAMDFDALNDYTSKTVKEILK